MCSTLNPCSAFVLYSAHRAVLPFFFFEFMAPRAGGVNPYSLTRVDIVLVDPVILMHCDGRCMSVHGRAPVKPSCMLCRACHSGCSAEEGGVIQRKNGDQAHPCEERHDS